MENWLLGDGGACSLGYLFSGNDISSREVVSPTNLGNGKRTEKAGTLVSLTDFLKHFNLGVTKAQFFEFSL